MKMQGRQRYCPVCAISCFFIIRLNFSCKEDMITIAFSDEPSIRCVLYVDIKEYS
jgi:hypothetical protein